MSYETPRSIEIPVSGHTNYHTSPLLSPSLASPLQSPSGIDTPLYLYENGPVSPSNEGAATSGKSTGQTFVHKLFDMIDDPSCQQLISWNYNGQSFIVCNVVEFSKDVLPKHFKHSNFSSFVRQLNMYGFHKINKTPRGQRGVAENQIWEFSHPKFLRGRTDLLDEIKRKAMDSEMLRREAGDMYGQISVMQVAQADIFQQLTQIQMHMNQMRKDLEDSRATQDQQNQVIRELLMSLTEQGIRVKNNVNEMLDAISLSHDNPTVYVTAAAENIPQYMNHQGQGQRESQQMRQPMNVNIPNYKNQPQPISMPMSPSSPFSMACNVPLPPSPMALSPAMDPESVFPTTPGGYDDDLRL
ncbi:hypothetical protein INT43_004785, partial [Umbelopsis isabellina]